MKLPPAPPQYDRRNEAETRAEIERDSERTVKRGQAQQSIVMQAPNGTFYRMTINNFGAWQSEPV